MSDIYVKVRNGVYQQHIVNGVFPLHKPFKRTNTSQHVTIRDEEALFAERPGNRRVKVQEGDYTYVDADGEVIDTAVVENPEANFGSGNNDSDDDDGGSSVFVSQYLDGETEEQAMARMRESFEVMEIMAKGALAGNIRGLIVSGPPGIGKSHGVKEAAAEVEATCALKDEEPPFEVISGAARPIGIYKKMFQYRHRNNTIIFDDCDTALMDETSLNLLKAALDSCDKRRISWLSESHALKQEDIPDAFDFEGSVVFLTNINFRTQGGRKLAPHLQAIMSRCHYLDLEINGTRDKMLRIRQIIEDGMLDDMQDNAQRDVVAFIEQNADHLQELSLRMVKKVADLRVTHPGKWIEIARNTCLTREGRFRCLAAA